MVGSLIDLMPLVVKVAKNPWSRQNACLMLEKMQHKRGRKPSPTQITKMRDEADMVVKYCQLLSAGNTGMELNVQFRKCANVDYWHEGVTNENLRM